METQGNERPRRFRRDNESLFNESNGCITQGTVGDPLRPPAYEGCLGSASRRPNAGYPPLTQDVGLLPTIQMLHALDEQLHRRLRWKLVELRAFKRCQPNVPLMYIGTSPVQPFPPAPIAPRATFTCTHDIANVHPTTRRKPGNRGQHHCCMNARGEADASG